MTRDKILALDLATRWGWAILDYEGRLHGWGTFLARATTKIDRWSRFRRQLGTIVSPELAEQIAELALEEAAGTRWRSQSAARVCYGFRAHAEHWAAQRGIAVEFVPQATVKLEATGSGGAEKIDVARACCQWFPGRGIEAVIEADGPWDGTDAIAVGLARVAIVKRRALVA